MSLKITKTGSAELTQVRGPFNDFTNGPYLPNCSLETNCNMQSSEMRSHESEPVVRNLEELFLNVDTIKDAFVRQHAGPYLTNCSLETNCIMQSSEKRTHESAPVVRNLEELFLNVDRVKDANVPQDAGMKNCFIL
nr:hypothetical protein Iba_chr05aCG8600 [Ipomoea batatas]